MKMSSPRTESLTRPLASPLWKRGHSQGMIKLPCSMPLCAAHRIRWRSIRLVNSSAPGQHSRRRSATLPPCAKISLASITLDIFTAPLIPLYQCYASFLRKDHAVFILSHFGPAASRIFKILRLAQQLCQNPPWSVSYLQKTAPAFAHACSYKLARAAFKASVRSVFSQRTPRSSRPMWP